MPDLCYTRPPSDSLVQGEILDGVVWHRVRPLSDNLTVGDIEVSPGRLPRIIVMNADCDLARDHEMRAEFTDDAARKIDPRIVWQVLCLPEIEIDLAQKLGNRKAKDLMETQPHPRVYRVLQAPVEVEGGTLGPYYFDLRNVLGIPTDVIYAGIKSGSINRLGVAPDRVFFGMLNRFHSWHSRVGL